MAYVTQVTISTANKVSLNYQSQEVSVTLTYQLEREDTDVLAVIREKTAELAQAHRMAWQGLRDARVNGKATGSGAATTVETANTTEPLDQTDDGEAAMFNASVTTPTAPEESMERVQKEAAPPEPPTPQPLEEPAKPGQHEALRLFCQQAGWDEAQQAAHLRQQFACDTLEGLSQAQATEWLLALQRAARQKAQDEKPARPNAKALGQHSPNGALNGTPNGAPT
jgi:hypothetical protein